ncbi:hypothetical protein [Isoptericola sp. NPDC056605]|uniref:hypothetical protein n=1 Tax=Isoptericola sp. NPDC056605 TaxID=3345876 RepID=UPI0036A300EA
MTESGDAFVTTPDGREPANSEPKDRYARTDAVTCGTLGEELDSLSGIVTAPGACPEGTDVVEITTPCEDGEYTLDALWVQRVQEDGTYDDAEQLSDDQCVTPADIAAQARREFKSMKIAAPEATVQGNPPMVVNVHYPAYTSAAPLDRTVTLLGVPVVLRAEPTEYTWDFDDPYSSTGSTLTTTSPGRPWHEGDATPDESWVGHTYSQLGTPGKDAGTGVDGKGNVYRAGVAVTLTTTWQGRFRVQGTSDWTDISGTISTTSTTDPTTVTEARTRLVCEDLEGDATC